MHYDSVKDLLVLENGVVDIEYKNGILGDVIYNVHYVRTNTKSDLLVMECFNNEIVIYPYKNIKKVRIYEKEKEE